MGTLLGNAYTSLDQKSKLFETNSIAIGTIELLQRKIMSKQIFCFRKQHFEKFINRMNEGYKMNWKISYGN